MEIQPKTPPGPSSPNTADRPQEGNGLWFNYFNVLRELWTLKVKGRAVAFVSGTDPTTKQEIWRLVAIVKR